jgi:hypothetical protein
MPTLKEILEMANLYGGTAAPGAQGLGSRGPAEEDPRRRRAGQDSGFGGISGGNVSIMDLLPHLQGLRRYDYSGPNIRGLDDLLPAMQAIQGPAKQHLLQQVGPDFRLPPGLAGAQDLPPGVDNRAAIGGPNVAPGNVDTGLALGQPAGIPGQALGAARGQMHTQGWRNVAPGGAVAAGFGYGTPAFEQKLQSAIGGGAAGIAGGAGGQKGPGFEGGVSGGGGAGKAVGGGQAAVGGGPVAVKAGGPAEAAPSGGGGGAGKPGAPAGGGAGAPGSRPSEARNVGPKSTKGGPVRGGGGVPGVTIGKDTNVVVEKSKGGPIKSISNNGKPLTASQLESVERLLGRELGTSPGAQAQQDARAALQDAHSSGNFGQGKYANETRAERRARLEAKEERQAKKAARVERQVAKAAKQAAAAAAAAGRPANTAVAPIRAKAGSTSTIGGPMQGTGSTVSTTPKPGKVKPRNQGQSLIGGVQR